MAHADRTPKRRSRATVQSELVDALDAVSERINAGIRKSATIGDAIAARETATGFGVLAYEARPALEALVIRDLTKCALSTGPLDRGEIADHVGNLRTLAGFGAVVDAKINPQPSRYADRIAELEKLATTATDPRISEAARAAARRERELHPTADDVERLEKMAAASRQQVAAARTPAEYESAAAAVSAVEKSAKSARAIVERGPAPVADLTAMTLAWLKNAATVRSMHRRLNKTATEAEARHLVQTTLAIDTVGPDPVERWHALGLDYRGFVQRLTKFEEMPVSHGAYRTAVSKYAAAGFDAELDEREHRAAVLLRTAEQVHDHAMAAEYRRRAAEILAHPDH